MNVRLCRRGRSPEDMEGAFYRRGGAIAEHRAAEPRYRLPTTVYFFSVPTLSFVRR